MNDAAIRDNVIRTLSQMGEPAVPIFASVLDDRRELLRGAAIDALGGSDVSVKMAVPSLIIVLLSDKSVEIREKSANLLGEIGTDAKETIPALTYALGDDSKNVRIKAVEALGE